jgi:hypothetical protein
METADPATDLVRRLIVALHVEHVGGGTTEVRDNAVSLA